ncbi:hypothetical protein ID866_13322 [Astraeus odoratus]|nr:hypothetical protein ID866_13322 [Astraeus odoratus]
MPYEGPPSTPSRAVLALRYFPPFLTPGRSHQLLIYIIQGSCDVIDLSSEKPSFRSRVGTVVRHSSTAFSISGRSGSGTPPPRDSDTAFIAGLNSEKHGRDESTSSLNKLQPPTSIRTRPVHSKPHLGVPHSAQLVPSVTIHKGSDSKLDVATPQPQPIAPAPTPELMPASKPSIPPARASVSPPYVCPRRLTQSVLPTQPTITSSFGYFDIPRGSTTSDGENPANVWEDHARSRETTSSPENVIPVQERVVS